MVALENYQLLTELKQQVWTFIISSQVFLTDFQDVFYKEASNKEPWREKAVVVPIHSDTTTHNPSAVCLPLVL